MFPASFHVKEVFQQENLPFNYLENKFPGQLKLQVQHKKETEFGSSLELLQVFKFRYCLFVTHF